MADAPPPPGEEEEGEDIDARPDAAVREVQALEAMLGPVPDDDVEPPLDPTPA